AGMALLSDRGWHRRGAAGRIVEDAPHGAPRRPAHPRPAHGARPTRAPPTALASAAGGILRAMATCLVTGGAGFLGSHLCDELLRRGHRVICVDNLETGSLANIAHIRRPEFVHLNVDIIE